LKKREGKEEKLCLSYKRGDDGGGRAVWSLKDKVTFRKYERPCSFWVKKKSSYSVVYILNSGKAEKYLGGAGCHKNHYLYG
jgi:hypothetical protein